MEQENETQIGDTALVLTSVDKAEYDTQIATAKAYPRSIRTFIDEAKQLVTLTEEVAEECMYSLPRGDKPIEGPSARFAEIIAYAWGNCRAGARTIGDDGTFVRAQGGFFDMQRNVAISYEVGRRITGRNGKRFNDDMVGVTANAACSIALRNAILKGIPKAFWKPIYDEARKCAIGDVTTLSARRAQMLGYFQKMGVTEQQILDLLKVKGVEDITLDHIATLKGLATSLKESETSVDAVFNGKAQDDSPNSLAAKMKAAKEAKGEAGKQGQSVGEQATAMLANQARKVLVEPGEQSADPMNQGGTHLTVKPDAKKESPPLKTGDQVLAEQGDPGAYKIQGKESSYSGIPLRSEPPQVWVDYATSKEGVATLTPEDGRAIERYRSAKQEAPEPGSFDE